MTSGRPISAETWIKFMELRDGGASRYAAAKTSMLSHASLASGIKSS